MSSIRMISDEYIHKTTIVRLVRLRACSVTNYRSIEVHYDIII